MPERTIFHATIRPNLSLSRRGFFVVTGIIGGIILLQMGFFAVIGAWPVVGFLGLDLLLFVGALMLSYRAAYQWERFHLTPKCLTITRQDRNLGQSRFTFDPYWVKITCARDQDLGTVKLTLRLSNQELEIARDLSPKEKISFHQALCAALMQSRSLEACN